jgi:hypothetical protein
VGRRQPPRRLGPRHVTSTRRPACNDDPSLELFCRAGLFSSRAKREKKNEGIREPILTGYLEMQTRFRPNPASRRDGARGNTSSCWACMCGCCRLVSSLYFMHFLGFGVGRSCVVSQSGVCEWAGPLSSGRDDDGGRLGLDDRGLLNGSDGSRCLLSGLGSLNGSLLLRGLLLGSLSRDGGRFLSLLRRLVLATRELCFVRTR